MLSTRTFTFNDLTYTVPKEWSDNACHVFVAKYCRSYDGTHLTPSRKFKERGVMDVLNRLVKFWTRSKSLRGDLFNDLWYQKASPNSPQYFNAGIAKAYGVEGANIGLWFINSHGIPQPTKATYAYPQLHACFINPIGDSLNGIIDLLTIEARLFSRGSGTGTNFSSLRAKGERLAGGGSSSGLISFLKVFDTMAGAIKSGGTTRRAAKMIVIDDDHPDIIEFIKWKAKEEAKAKVLAEAGYGDGWQSESYTTITGQNANNSISVSDKFMFTLAHAQDWHLVGRRDKLVNRSIPARLIWDAICDSAWNCADPGLHFTDTINDWNTTPKSGTIRASNPCSEHLRLDNSACNLASLNLCAFWEHPDVFNIDDFVETTRRWVDVLDMSIDLAGYPSREIAETTYQFRDIGLGFCNLGALLLRLTLPYDSETGRLLASLLSSLLTGVAYLRSAERAELMGHYPAYPLNKHSHLDILNRHYDAMTSLNHEDVLPNVKQLVDDLTSACTLTWSEALRFAERHGLRNAQLTVIAPTGTIGLTMDCETTGIEPIFAINTVKELAGGGQLNQTAKSVDIAKSLLTYKPDVKTDPLFKTAVGPNALSPQAHVNMVAAIQPHVSGGISKTVNLPATATVKDIANIYYLAYKSGIKCISVYRDGSKSQPLTADCKKCGDDEACEL